MPPEIAICPTCGQPVLPTEVNPGPPQSGRQLRARLLRLWRLFQGMPELTVRVGQDDVGMVRTSDLESLLPHLVELANAAEVLAPEASP